MAKKKVVEETPVAKEVKTEKAGAYTLEVQVNDVHYKGKAKSLEQAIKDFVESKDFPVGVKTRALVRFGKGSKLSQRLYQTVEARRVFNLLNNKEWAQQLMADRMESALS